MLAAKHRMRSPLAFSGTVRKGIRVGSPTVVVHARCVPELPVTQVGFVVSKAVGNAVKRNRIKRQLRHLVAREPLDVAGRALVVRALPGAAITPDRLSGDFQHTWARACAQLACTPVKLGR